eukprot:Platyproteum_vivax@DN4344_c0_g1_i1.p1
MGACHPWKKRRDDVVIRNPSNIRYVCPICAQELPSNASASQINRHVDQCLGPSPALGIRDRESLRHRLENPGLVTNVLLQDLFGCAVREVTPAEAGKQYARITMLSCRDIAPMMSRPFEEKKKWFYDQIETFRVSWQVSHVRIDVERHNLLLTSFNQFRSLSRGDLHKELKFGFVGEPAQDAGGLTREWFTLIIESIFNPNFYLFCLSDCDTVTYQINPNSWINEAHLDYFEFAGRCLGKAIFEKVAIKATLCRPLLKQLLGGKADLEDLAYADMQLYNSLIFMQSSTIEGIIFDNFCVEEDKFGSKQVTELKPNGKNIPVTDNNKDAYIGLRANYQIYDAVSEQIHHLQRGLYDVIPVSILRVFDLQELEMLINGMPVLDMGDWKSHTCYMGAYTCSHEVIVWFWEVVSAFSDEHKARLLQFSTGTSRLPVDGFEGLESNRGQKTMFTVQSVEFSDCAPFPRAHTCFNRLDLPLYKTKAELKLYLTQAVQMDVTGFGLE